MSLVSCAGCGLEIEAGYGCGVCEEQVVAIYVEEERMTLATKFCFTLNRLLGLDGRAARVLCATYTWPNQALIDDEHFVVTVDEGVPPEFGVVGLLNGVLREHAPGSPLLCACFEPDGTLFKFELRECATEGGESG